jgi:hypothetical protein
MSQEQSVGDPIPPDGRGNDNATSHCKIASDTTNPPNQTAKKLQ